MSAALAADDDNDKLEQVVVTSQRRAEDLQSVPISAQVVSGQILAEQNHSSLEELTETMSGVHISSDEGSTNLFIRGIGSGGSAFFDQSVAIFVDDNYHGRSHMSLASFLDLDRIEVLKGPQSTFFGNNAIAGALNIVSRKPGAQLNAWGRALYGMFGEYAAEGAIGFPITDALGVRLAVSRNGFATGWIENVDLGQHVPRINNLSGRLTLDFHPTGDLDAILKVEGSKHRTSGASADQPYQWTNCPPPVAIPADYPPQFGKGCAYALANHVPIGLDQNKTEGIAGQGNQLSTFEDVLTVNYQRWGYTFTSVTGFYNYHFDTEIDYTFAPVTAATGEIPERLHQFSQEFRVASPVNQPLEYLGGVYFQTDQLATNSYTNIPGVDFIASLPGLTALAPYLPLALGQKSQQGEHVYSAFVSLSWNASDSLKLNAGLRGSRVNKDFAFTSSIGTGTRIYGGFEPLPPAILPLGEAVFPGYSGTSQSLNRSDQAWMPSAGIQYRVSSGAMAYFTYSKGFKAGGFNGQNPHYPTADQLFGPEHVSAYELGVKSKWIEDTLLLNLDIFRSNYKDLQVTELVSDPVLGLVQLTTNAATSRSQGVEFETQWAMSKSFRLKSNLTYLDSRYTSYPNAGGTALQLYNGIQFQDLSGQPTEFAPKWSGSLTASYMLVFPNSYKFTTEFSPYHSSSYYLHPSDEVFFQQKSFTRLDGRLSLESADGHWSLDLIGKNLTDAVVYASPGGYYQASKLEPRNVALQFLYRL
jgi:outer membrane receptor protein involved in Fe transport